MILPYQRHLEWLLLEGQSEEQIQKFYYNIQFPKITKASMEAAREKIQRLPLPPMIRRNLNRGVFRMEDNGIWSKLGYGEMHARRCTAKPTREWENVGKLLAHPVMRLAVDCCLITKLDHEKIHQLLPQVYSLPLSVNAISLYEEIFFNCANMDRDDWVKFMDLHREDPYSYQRLYAALTKSTDEVLFLLGLPTQKQYTDFLKNVLAASHFKFQFYMRQNTPDADAEARKWAKVGFEAGEKFEKYGASDITDFAKLVQTEFEYVTPEIPTLTPELLSSVIPTTKEESKENKKLHEPIQPDHPSFRDNESV